MGLTGALETFSFDYCSYALLAQAPDGEFTEEEREVVEILTSFREDYDR